MLMAVNEPYALMVQPDDILISPREVDEHFGTMVCFHPRYALGDHHNHMDKDDFLREMYLDTVGHDEAGMKRYERMVNIVSSRFRHGPKTEERAIDEAMQKVISEKYLKPKLWRNRPLWKRRIRKTRILSCASCPVQCSTCMRIPTPTRNMILTIKRSVR